MKKLMIFLVFVFLGYANLSALNTFNLPGNPSVFVFPTEEQYTMSGPTYGFMDFQEGFHITNASTTLALGINSIIRGGFLRLDNLSTMIIDFDLHLTESSKFIIGTSPGDVAFLQGVGSALVCHGNLIIPAQRALEVPDSNFITIDGKGHDIIFEPGAQLRVGDMSLLYIKNAVLKNINGVASSNGSIALLTMDSSVILENVTIDLSGTYTLDQGTMLIRDYVSIEGENQVFAFASRFTDLLNKRNLIVDSNSTLCFSIGTTFVYSQPSNAAEDVFAAAQMLVLTDKSSRLLFDGCTVKIPVVNTPLTLGGNPYGSFDVGAMYLTKGTVTFKNRVIIESLLSNGNLPSPWGFISGGIPYTYVPGLQWGGYGVLLSLDVNLEFFAGAEVETYGFFTGGNTV